MTEPRPSRRGVGLPGPLVIYGWCATAGCLLMLTVTVLWTYYLSAQHGFQELITTNSMGEFWPEVAILFAMLGLCLWGLFIIFRDAWDHPGQTL